MGAVKCLMAMVAMALFLGVAAGPGLGAVCHQMEVHCTCGKSGWNVHTRTVKTVWDLERAKCVPEGCNKDIPGPQIGPAGSYCGVTVRDYCHWYIDKCTDPVDHNSNPSSICWKGEGSANPKSRPSVWMRLDSTRGGHRLSNVYPICPEGWSMHYTDYND
jgi:hypothetical protein